MNLIQSGDTLASVVSKVIGIVNAVTPVLVGVAILTFFYGIVLYIYASGDAKGHARGREIIIWGLVALFVLFSLWGIIELMCVSLFSSYCGAINTPSPL